MQCAPKKYLVETEDNGVSGPGMEADLKTFKKLNDIAKSTELSQKQRKQAKRLLNSNRQLARMVLKMGIGKDDEVEPGNGGSSLPKTQNKFLGGILSGIMGAVAPALADLAHTAVSSAAGAAANNVLDKVVPPAQR